MNDDVLTRVQALKPIADEAGLTMAQLAVAWVLQNDNVAAALVGASRPEQVHENVKAAGVKLEPELMQQIDDVLGDIVERDPGKTAETAPEDARRLNLVGHICVMAFRGERHRRPPATVHAAALSLAVASPPDLALGWV